MKRKLLLCSTLLPSLLAWGASAQVINFNAANNGFVSLPGTGYDALFAGQGVYPDPGNNLWNGFGNDAGYKSTYFYSDQPAATGGGTGPWPQPSGNPGNPYAWYSGITSSGTALFNFTTGGSGLSGNATSAGLISPITISITGSSGDNGAIGGDASLLNGSPYFLLGNATINSGGNLGITLGNVPPGNYGMYIYNANFNNDRGAAYSFEPANGGVAHRGISATTNEDNPSGHPDVNGFVEGGNFVIFENLTPDSSSNIVITGTPILNPSSQFSGETDLNAIQLIANPAPTSVGLNAASNVISGQTAAFSFSPVFADEGTTTPGYQWQYSANNGVSWVNVGVNSSALTIAGATLANAGLYHCLITDMVTHVVGTSPPASLGIITAATNVLLPTDSLIDVSNNITLPGNTIPSPIYMTVADAVDGSLFMYENFGINGSTTTTGFAGPAGFIVTPGIGFTTVTGMRIFTASTHPEADPLNYVLLGSTTGTNGPWTTITSGTLSLPLTRNWGGGAINLNNQALQEVDFANSQYERSYQLVFTHVRNDAGDSNGVQVAEVQLLGSISGPPIILQNPTPSSAEVPACPTAASVTLTASANGAPPLNYQWILNGATTVQTGASPIYTFNALSGTNTYDVIITGSIAPPATSSVATVIGVSGDPPTLTFANTNNWSLNPASTNQAVPIFTGGGLELTDGNGGEWSSAFYGTTMYIKGFLASFIYTPSGGADGTTFCIQNDSRGATALGTSSGGGGLGFDVIQPSFAFEMDLYVHGAPGPGVGATAGPGIAFGTNGATPFSANPPTPPCPGYFTPGAIDLDSGDPVFVQLYYMKSNLSVFMEDQSTLATFSTNLQVNLPSLVGGNVAYIGFTGADGGVTSIQTITDFSYSYTTPPVLSIARGTPGNVVVSWPVSVASAFTLYQSSSLSGPWTASNVSSLTQTGCENSVTLPYSGAIQYFLLSLDQPTF